MRKRLIDRAFVLAALTTCVASGAAGPATQRATQPATRATVPLTITGGHDTDRRDGGRPVVLIATALGVSVDVFRDAFSQVRPARNGDGPTDAQARQNKRALMDALAKHGVTNERLDEVSNFYRYRPGPDSLWRHTPAAGYATIENGRVVAVTMTEPGAGYSSTPNVTLGNRTEARLSATVAFGKKLQTNGSIAKVAIAPPTTQP